MDRMTYGYFTSWTDACEYIEEMNIQDEVEIDYYIDENGNHVFEVIEKEFFKG